MGSEDRWEQPRAVSQITRALRPLPAGPVSLWQQDSPSLTTGTHVCSWPLYSMASKWLHCTWRKEGRPGGQRCRLQRRTRFLSPTQYLPLYLGLRGGPGGLSQYTGSPTMHLTQEQSPTVRLTWERALKVGSSVRVPDP